MATDPRLESLLASLEQSVNETLAYFEGPGGSSDVRVGEWGPWDVVCHFLFWHEAATAGMESVARGGEPPRMDASTDDINARTVAQHRGEGIRELTAQARPLQERLARAARSLPDLDAAVLVRLDGTESTAAQRLETIARHWSNHVRELQSQA